MKGSTLCNVLLLFSLCFPLNAEKATANAQLENRPWSFQMRWQFSSPLLRILSSEEIKKISAVNYYFSLNSPLQAKQRIPLLTLRS